MIGLLYTFGIGIAFAGGCVFGLFVFQCWKKESDMESDKEKEYFRHWQIKHAERVEDRLERYAVSAEKIAKILEGKNS